MGNISQVNLSRLQDVDLRDGKNVNYVVDVTYIVDE